MQATTAKIKFLQTEEVDQKALGDGMNEYYDSHYETETVESNMKFVQPAVPKTPLQQTILSIDIFPPLRDTNTPENKTQNNNLNERNKTKTGTQTAQDYFELVVDAAHDNLNVVIQRQYDTAELCHRKSCLPVPVTCKKHFCV